MSRTATILARYQEAASEIFPKVFIPECCLNGTAVFLQVAEHFGIEAKPLVVQATACNAVFYRLWKKGGTELVVKESKLRAKKRSRHWPQCVQIDDESPPALMHGGIGWPGHLIAVAEGFIVDSAAGAFSRPKKRIFMPTIFVGELESHDQLREFGPNQECGFVETETGSAIIYGGTDRQDFRTTHGFTAPHNKAVAEGVIRLMGVLK